MRTFNTGIKGFDALIRKIQEEHGDIVQDAFRENDGCFGTQLSYWIHLDGGYVSVMMETGTFHEGNLKSLKDAIDCGIMTREQFEN